MKDFRKPSEDRQSIADDRLGTAVLGLKICMISQYTTNFICFSLTIIDNVYFFTAINKIV